LLGALIDDAGLFPPAALSMREALAARSRALAGDAPWIVGRFVVPASRLRELEAALKGTRAILPVSVVIDASEPLAAIAALGREAKADDSRIAVEAIELPLARIAGGRDDVRLDALRRGLVASGFDASTEAYLELAWDGDLDAQLGALRGARANGLPFNAKFRCGGPSAAAIPSPDVLARAIWNANRLQVPFKATAGLHHPLRHRDAALGATAHGFLNVLGGALLAHAHGLDEPTLGALIEDEDGAHFTLDADSFAWRGVVAGASEIAAARARFARSYGSCSLQEPIDDLRSLGMLPALVR